MLIHDNIGFHNVAELHDDGDGLRLQRVPELVRQQLNENAAARMLAAAGTEIRFVSTADRICITLSATGDAELIPFFGPLQGKERFQIPAERTIFEIERPERLKMMDERTQTGLWFSPDVWRLTLRGPRGAGGRPEIRYHGIDGEALRAPNDDETPRIRYLAYGTSITQGAAASAGHLTYAAQTAALLQADLINLGVGGAAWCEPVLADYIAERDDWDIATLELSVNMVGAGFSDDEFRERVTYMLDRVARTNTGKPVVCITIFPHFRDFSGDPAAADHVERFRTILRETHASLGHPNTTLIEGADMLADPAGLTVDLLHPGDAGMTQMATHLATRMKPMLSQQYPEGI